MNETLRPSTLGEILDRVFQLYRANFWRFVGIAALPLAAIFAIAIPIGLLFLIPGIASGGRGPATIIGVVALVVAVCIVLPVYLALYAISIAGLTEATVSAHRGEKPTIRAAFKSAWQRLGTYVWLLLLQVILVGIVPICAASALLWPLFYPLLKSGIGAGPGLGVGVVLGAMVTSCVIVWLGLSLAMGMSACVVEKKTAWQSLKRSWRLRKGTRGRIFVLYLLILALSMVATMISYFVMFIGVLVASLAGKGSAAAVLITLVSGILYAVVSLGTQIALMPVPWVGLVLFYYDQRIRKEGFDIEWMMQQAGLAQALSIPAAVTGAASFPPVTPPDTLGER